MTLFVFFSLVVFFFYLQAGVFLFLRKPVVKSNRLFAYSLFALSWTSFFFVLIQFTENIRLVYLIDRINMIGWIYLPFLLLLFLMNMTGKNSGSLARIVTYALGALAAILMIRHLWHPQSLMIYYQASSGMWYFDLNVQSVWVYIALSYNFGSAVAGFVLAQKFFFQSMKSHIKKVRIQSKVFFISFSLFLLLSVLGHVFFPLFSIPVLPAMVHLAALPMVGAIFFSTILVHPQTFFREMISGIFIRRIREFVFFLDHNGLIYSVNQHTLDVLKYNRSEVFNKEPGVFFKPPAFVVSKLQDAIMNHKTDDLICLISSREGAEFPVKLNITKVYDAFRNMVGFLLIAYDFRQTKALQLERMERLRIEKKLIARNLELEIRIEERSSELGEVKKRLDIEHVKQKEIEKQVFVELRNKGEMVRELHHRVKNNIQMTISLINIERGKCDTDQQQDQFYASIANRILTISMIHDYLYDTPQMGKINLKHYVHKIMGELRSIYPSKSHVLLNVSFDEGLLSISQAIPCGIIIFELLSNSLRHAFPEVNTDIHSAAASARINLEFVSEQNKSRIQFSDNGIGIALNDGKPVRKLTGLTLVELLIKEYLQGTISYTNSKGTSIQIGFKHDENNGI